MKILAALFLAMLVPSNLLHLEEHKEVKVLYSVDLDLNKEPFCVCMYNPQKKLLACMSMPEFLVRSEASGLSKPDAGTY
jgi:hypothetical protein